MDGWGAHRITRHRFSRHSVANSSFHAPYEANAKAWYKKAQERVMFLNHAIIHPPVDRDRPIHDPHEARVPVGKDGDGGCVVTGAKSVATGSALTHPPFVAHHGLIPVQDRKIRVCLYGPHECSWRETYLLSVVREHGSRH